MTTRSPRPTSPDPLLFPEWIVAVLYFAVIPIGLLVGYLACRGYSRTDRPGARLLAVGLVLLTAVDTVLATTVSIGGVVELSRATPVLRAFVQFLGVLCIILAMYLPTRSSRWGGAAGEDAGPPRPPVSRRDGDERSNAGADSSQEDAGE